MSRVGWWLSEQLAWALIALLGCFALLAIWTIGIYVLPIVLLLGYAALITPSGTGRLREPGG